MPWFLFPPSECEDILRLHELKEQPSQRLTYARNRVSHARLSINFALQMEHRKMYMIFVQKHMTDGTKLCVQIHESILSCAIFLERTHLARYTSCVICR